MRKAISPRAKREWQRLTEWYGTRFTEQYGDTPPDDWAEVIDRADPETLKRGLNTIRAKYAVHPPTLPQFDQAMAPVREPGTKGPSVADRLCQHVMRNYASRMTPKQIRGPWTYTGRTFAALDVTGKMVEGQGMEIDGVDIAADGDSPGIHVTVAEINADAFLDAA
jgi:hypothetical protein